MKSNKVITSNINSKVTMVGGGQTGKTSILLRLIDNDFNSECEPTIFENRMATFMVDNIPVDLYIWDTAGQEDFGSIIPLTYTNTDIAILCYSIVDRYSFEAITEKWVKELKFHTPESEIILVGTKSDLKTNIEYDDIITANEGEILAKSLNAIAFFECSALTGHNIQNIFDLIAKHEFHKKNTFKKKKKKGFFLSLFELCNCIKKDT